VEDQGTMLNEDGDLRLCKHPGTAGALPVDRSLQVRLLSLAVRQVPCAASFDFEGHEPGSKL